MTLSKFKMYNIEVFQKKVYPEGPAQQLRRPRSPIIGCLLAGGPGKPTGSSPSKPEGLRSREDNSVSTSTSLKA